MSGDMLLILVLALGGIVIFILERIREALRGAVLELAPIKAAINGPSYSNNSPISDHLEDLTKDVSAISEGVEQIRCGQRHE